MGLLFLLTAAIVNHVDVGLIKQSEPLERFFNLPEQVILINIMINRSLTWTMVLSQSGFTLNRAKVRVMGKGLYPYPYTFTPYPIPLRFTLVTFTLMYIHLPLPLPG